MFGEHIPARAPVRREVPQVRESLRHRPGSRRKRALVLLQVVWHRDLEQNGLHTFTSLGD